jgi:type IV pilus assembly protein PilC
VNPGTNQEDLRLSRPLLVLLTRQLSVLVDAGIPLRYSLDVLAQSSMEEEERAVLTWLVKAVESGWRLSDAMKVHSKTFDKVYTSMIEVGEETGQLCRTLQSLSVWIDSEQSLIRDVKSKLTYPAVVVVVAVLLTIFYLVVIFPGFAGFLTQGDTIPLPTQILMLLSQALSNPLTWLLAIPTLVLGYKSLRTLLRSGRYRIAIWKNLSYIPVVSHALQYLTCSRFCSAMNILMGSGVDILKSFRLSSLASGSPIIAEDIGAGIDTITHGGSLSDHLALNPNSYPGMMVGLVATGEEAASLPKVFGRLAKMLEEEARWSFEMLAAVMEPVIMMLISILVAILIFSTAMPIYALIRDTL